MSSVARHGELATRRGAAQRVRAAGRSRRADAGAVAEMARSLLREADGAEARRRRGGTVRAERAVRRELTSAPRRLSPRQLAAPPA